jgi:hypothetical protein
MQKRQTNPIGDRSVANDLRETTGRGLKSAHAGNKSEIKAENKYQSTKS